MRKDTPNRLGAAGRKWRCDACYKIFRRAGVSSAHHPRRGGRMYARWLFLLALLLATVVGAQVPADLMLVDATPNATFNLPLAARAPHDGSGRLFVVEKCGTIKIVENGIVLS
ncbi:MAG TPA: hypothetical protein VLK26_05555, partial [Rudaea sp.]|nr:hypothetical protein [Rudaea sp.]